MQTRRQGNMWVITTDPVWTRVATPDGGAANQSKTSMTNMVEAYHCWSERGWAAPSDGSMLFLTDKSAGEYMTANRLKM